VLLEVAVSYERDVPGAVEGGAAGVSFGFLDADLEVDTEVCTHLASSLANVPWTFHRAVDDTLDPRRSWRRLLGLPGLVNVCSAGSPRSMGEGYDDLLATAETDPAIAALLMPGGGLPAEHVPWLVRAGVRAFHVDLQARPGGSQKAYVDAGLTRSWRLLLDDAMERI
jgi:copper homeostasis protein